MQHCNLLIKYCAQNDILSHIERILIIDYEYSALTSPAYDIANHFCEYMADYSSTNETPHILDASKYPTIDNQRTFLDAYLNYGGQILMHYSIDNLLDEIYYYTLCSHLLWGYWSIVQGCASSIHFDYFNYGLQRFTLFDQMYKCHF